VGRSDLRERPSVAGAVRAGGDSRD